MSVFGVIPGVRSGLRGPKVIVYPASALRGLAKDSAACRAACCGPLPYTQARYCSDGSLAPACTLTTNIHAGECRSNLLGGRCIVFDTSAGPFVAATGTVFTGFTGYDCCDCEGTDGDCLWATNDGTNAMNPLERHCCCGRKDPLNAAASLDCEWRITAYSYDVDVHSTVFPFTQTHDIYTITSLPTAWTRYGITLSPTIRRSRSINGGAAVITTSAQNFSMFCGGYPLTGTPDTTWYGWPHRQGPQEIWYLPGLPAGARLGCNPASGTYSYTGRYTQGAPFNQYTDYVVTFTFETRCGAIPAPCAKRCTVPGAQLAVSGCSNCGDGLTVPTPDEVNAFGREMLA